MTLLPPVRLAAAPGRTKNLMLYDIRLHLHYDYARSSGGSRHQIRVAPRTIDGVQRVVASSLSFDPTPAERADFVDFFGNNAATIAFRDEHETLDIRMNARVAVSRPQPGLDVRPMCRVCGASSPTSGHWTPRPRTTFSPPAISSTSTPRSPSTRASAWLGAVRLWHCLELLQPAAQGFRL